MTFPLDVLNSPVPGVRAARVASTVTRNGTGEIATLYRRLSQLMCWDAAILCAYVANAVRLPAQGTHTAQHYLSAANSMNVVSAATYHRLFPTVGPQAEVQRTVHGLDELRQLPIGCFVGFIREGAQPILGHVMLHVGRGIGAGNQNHCIFRGSARAGWKQIDMAPFFREDFRFERNLHTRMIYAPVTGQTL